ncbi:MAG: hypothetical protein A2X36_08925 [Elusimicrobia bacterium GWA2_69_24]|nr:MAG: hypothetical protein A2X36_08925 [Elusimicrobia bacterium GWA2_69_24]
MIGTAGIIALMVVGMASGEVSRVFLNLHGLLIVFGGTAAAMLVNTPMQYVRETLIAMASLFRRDPYDNAQEVVPLITRLAEMVQRNGLGSLRNADPNVAGGFLAAAATTALEYNNPEFVRHTLETEVNNGVDRANEVINVIRTAGVVSPMFGLIGTLLGIIQVLKNIANPDMVGSSMAIAITSAFYGIMFANLVCIPVAGKLRMRLWEQIKMKAMVIEGVIGMMQGTVPLVLERKLMAFK